MFTKIVSFTLATVILISCFAVYSFADVTHAGDTYIEEYISPDFENYLDVDTYAAKAGTEGYTDLLLVGISKPIVSVDADNSDPTYVDLRVSFKFYFYNPMLLPIRARLSSYDAFVGNASVMFPGDSNYKTVSLYTGIGWSDSEKYSQMFISGSVIHSLGKFKASDNINYSEYIESLTYKFKDVSFVTYEGKRYDFAINDSVSADIIDYTLGTSSPLSDLACFLNTDVATIKKNYPLSDTADYSSVVFLYENITLNELYIYIYDSEGWFVGSKPYGYSNISLNDVELGECKFEFINSENSIAKFKLLNAYSVFSKINLNSDRKYFIDGFSCNYLSSYDFSQIKRNIVGTFDFTYSGDENSRDINSSSNQIVLLDVGNTYYRLNSSNTGEGYYKTLSSVYFSLSNTFFELDDDNYLNDRWVERISGRYLSCMSDYTLVARNAEYLEILKNWKINGYDILTWATALQIGTYSYSCDVGYGSYLDFYAIAKAVGYDVLKDVYYPGGDFEELFIEFDEEFISSEMQEHFIEVEATKFDFTKGDSFDLLSRDSLTLGELISDIGLISGIWSYIFGFSDSVDASIKDINAFDTLRGERLKSALALSPEAFCDTYYVAMSDYGDIYNKMSACYENDETFVFLRFDVFDYYAADVDFIRDDKYFYKFDYPEGNVFCFQTKLYSDFEVLEFELCNQYDSKIYNVSMQPISFVSGITTPDPFDPETDLPGIDEILPDLIPDFNLDFLKPLAAVVGGVLLIVVVYVVFDFVYKVSVIRTSSMQRKNRNNNQRK